MIVFFRAKNGYIVTEFSRLQSLNNQWSMVKKSKMLQIINLKKFFSPIINMKLIL